METFVAATPAPLPLLLHQPDPAAPVLRPPRLPRHQLHIRDTKTLGMNMLQIVWFEKGKANERYNRVLRCSEYVIVTQRKCMFRFRFAVHFS